MPKLVIQYSPLFFFFNFSCVCWNLGLVLYKHHALAPAACKTTWIYFSWLKQFIVCKNHKTTVLQCVPSASNTRRRNQREKPDWSLQDDRIETSKLFTLRYNVGPDRVSQRDTGRAVVTVLSVLRWGNLLIGMNVKI